MFQYIPSNKCVKCESKLCNNVQIPNLPLLGPKAFDQILRDICKAVEAEAAAAEFYRHLMKEAPNKLHRDFIEHAYCDELKHLEMFSKLYCYYTDNAPEYHVDHECFPCYHEALLKALIGELEAVEFYKNVQLSTTDQLIRDCFFLAMVDEQEHATMFSTLYHSCK